MTRCALSGRCRIGNVIDIFAFFEGVKQIIITSIRLTIQANFRLFLLSRFIFKHLLWIDNRRPITQRHRHGYCVLSQHHITKLPSLTSETETIGFVPLIPAVADYIVWFPGDIP